MRTPATAGSPGPSSSRPAIELAGAGFPADDAFVAAVEASLPVFRDALGPAAAGWTTVYRPHGRPWRAGELVVLPALAATLRRLAEAGPDDLYAGELAARQAAGLAAAGSAITAADLAAHASSWETPLALDYRGAVATTHPPNSSGVVALEILNVLRSLEAPDRAAFAPGAGGATAGADARWAHLGIEATKRALADRDRHLSDPEFVDAPVERLLDAAYGAELAGGIDPDRASEPPPSRAPRGAARSGSASSTGTGTR